LTISASTSFAHDFYTNVIHRGTERKPGEEVKVARVTAFVVGAVAMAVAILLGPNANVAFLVALRFAVAHRLICRNCAVFVLESDSPRAGPCADWARVWRRPILLIIVSPASWASMRPARAPRGASLIQSPPIFPLENPGNPEHFPLGFAGALLGTFLGREPAAAAKTTNCSSRLNGNRSGESTCIKSN